MYLSYIKSFFSLFYSCQYFLPLAFQTGAFQLVRCVQSAAVPRGGLGCSVRYWLPSSQGGSGAATCNSSPTFKKLLGGSRENPKQRSSDCVRSLLAMSRTGHIPHTLLCGNLLKQPKGALQPGCPLSASCRAHLCLVALGPWSCWRGLGTRCPDHSPRGLRAGASPGGSLESWSWHRRCCHVFVLMDSFSDIQATCKVTALITPVFSSH